MAIYATVESGNVKETFTRHTAFELNGLKYPRNCLLYTSPSPRDKRQSRMPSSA